MTIYKIFVIAALLCMGGCASPTIKTDSLSSRKELAFPKVGVQSVARPGVVAAFYTNYTSSQVFRLKKPINIPVMIGARIAVTTEENLIESDVNGETVFCTTNKTYNDPLTSPWAVACFKSGSPGKFASVTYRPGAIWFTKELSPEADFLPLELQSDGQIKPIKRELVFEGSQDNVLLFSERIYYKSLDTPSAIKPLKATVASLPNKVRLDGMEINVLLIDDKGLTFEAISPWQ